MRPGPFQSERAYEIIFGIHANVRADVKERLDVRAKALGIDLVLEGDDSIEDPAVRRNRRRVVWALLERPEEARRFVKVLAAPPPA